MVSLLLALVLTLISLTSTSYARNDYIPGSRYSPAAALGMGDAYLSMGEDVPAALYNNPAHVGKFRHFTAEYMNISLGMNRGFLSSVDGSFYNSIFLSNYKSNLARVAGTYAGTTGSFFTGIGFPGFAIGLLAESDLMGLDHGNGTLTYRSFYQIVPAAAVGFKLLKGVIRLGYSIQWVNQSYGKITGASSSMTAYNAGLYEGSGFSHNAGLTVSLPLPLRPTLDFVARNIMGTQYSPATLFPIATNPIGVPATEPMTFDASIGIQSVLGHNLFLNLLVVDRDILNQSGEPTFLKHFSMGAEFDYHRKYYFRGGLRGGIYPSFGLGIRHRSSTFDLAFYFDEVGTIAAPQSDLRLMLQYTLGKF